MLFIYVHPGRKMLSAVKEHPSIYQVLRSNEKDQEQATAWPMMVHPPENCEGIQNSPELYTFSWRLILGCLRFKGLTRSSQQIFLLTIWVKHHTSQYITLFRLHFYTKRIKDLESNKVNMSVPPSFSHFNQKSWCCCTLDTWGCRTACDWSHAAPGWARCHWGCRGWRGRSGWTPQRLCIPRSSCSHNTQLEICFYPAFEYFHLLFTYEIVIIDLNHSPMLWVPQSILDATKLHEALLGLQRSLNILYHCLVDNTAI